MARGYKSTHPQTEQLLRELGVPTDDVTQGYGTAKASAGYHLAVGSFGGRQYSDCVDLRWKDDYLNRDFFDRCIAGGLIPFPRDWSGNQHIHCVQVGLTDDAGKCQLLAGPRTQIIDALNGRNGLVGHALMSEKWRLTTAQKRDIRQQYTAWAPHVRTKVFGRGGLFRCYAFMEREDALVSVELRSFVEKQGYQLVQAGVDSIGDPVPTIILSPKGQRLEKTIKVWQAGNFLRCWIKDIAKLMERQLEFIWEKDKSAASICLYGKG